MFSGLSGYIKGVKNALHGTATQAKPTLGRVRVGNREIDEIKLISQGGYAYVFLVKDTQTGETFALKKMICQSPERFQTAKNEIKMLRSLPNHPNLLRVFDSSVETKGDCYYVYVLLEYCDGGSIFDLMAKYEASKLSEKQIIFIMREVCEGVKVLHSCNPPIAHRDLKIENVLLSNKRFKLCDFGSCSTSYVDFSKIPQSQYATYEEEYDKNTTLMYRPPEMCDPYQRQIVSQKVDIWMLGCILYTMCFYKHPFQEMTKLSIVNAAYTFPEDHPYPEKLIDLIRIMLTPHPNYRPDIFEICDLMNSYFDIKSVKLNPDAQRIREEQKKNAMEMRKFENPNSKTAKFNGDIPIEELMKIQKQLQRDEDESPMANKQFQSEERNNRQQQQRQQSRQNGPKPHHHHFDSFDSFGKPKKQAPEIHHFNSSPGLQQNNEWHNFGQKSAEKQTPKQSSNSQWDSFGQSPPPKQLSSFAQFGSSNQDRSNNQSNQSVTNQNSSNDQWKNFNSTPASGSNNTMNNSGNAWAQNNWAPQNQQSQTQPQSVPNNWAPQNQQSQIAQNNWASQNQQSQSAQNWSSQNQQFQSNNNFNAFNSQPSNNQRNNTWNSFGSNTNNQFSQNNNSNGMNQTQNNVPTVTNDLLDLADTSAKSKTPNIMDLYSMNK